MWQTIIMRSFKIIWYLYHPIIRWIFSLLTNIQIPFLILERNSKTFKPVNYIIGQITFQIQNTLFKMVLKVSISSIFIFSFDQKISYKSCLHGNHKRIHHLIKTCLVSWENAKVVSWENIQTLFLIDLLPRNFLMTRCLQKIMALREIWLFYYFPKTTFLLWLSKWIPISLNVQV